MLNVAAVAHPIFLIWYKTRLFWARSVADEGTEMWLRRAVQAAVFIAVLGNGAVNAQKPPAEMQQPAVRDGQHDFDFEIGAWKTRLKRLAKPLSGSKTWLEYQGTSVMRKVWNGRANLLELDVEGDKGHIEGLSLRLYNPESHQWSLNFSNSRSGTLTSPVFGEFRDGRGEFFGVDTLGSRAILVRFIITRNSEDSYHFEQAFSDDAGKTWEVNWIADDTKIKDSSSQKD